MRQIYQLSLAIVCLLVFFQTHWIGGAIADDEAPVHPTLIEALDVEQLPSGRHHFYFKAAANNTGTPVSVPIMVLKGNRSGKKLMLTAGVHGDELNGIRVIHSLFEQLDPSQISGSIIAVPGLNQPGLRANIRFFPKSSGGGSQDDLNRLFPGKSINSGAASAYVNSLWQSVLKKNADIAIDLHTQTRGTAYPLFVFADFRNRFSRDVAYRLGPDMIKNDVGEEGTLETTYMRAGVPAVTLEVGEAKVFQPKLIERAVNGILAVMIDADMLDTGLTAPAAPKPIVGRDYINIYAKSGGSVVTHVSLKQKVSKGDHLATQYSAFGEVLHEYYAPRSGHVLAVNTDPLREPGALLVRILY